MFWLDLGQAHPAQCRASSSKCWSILANPHSGDVPDLIRCCVSGEDALQKAEVGKRIPYESHISRQATRFKSEV